MELRYTLAVVTPAGAGPGREVAVGLARAGAAVLVVDPDGPGATRTAQALGASRTRAWSLQADPSDPDDARLVAQRARDLGGADVLVDLTDPPTSLAELVAADADDRRGPRRTQSVAVVSRSATAGRRCHHLVLGPDGTATDVVALLRKV